MYISFLNLIPYFPTETGINEFFTFFWEYSSKTSFSFIVLPSTCVNTLSLIPLIRDFYYLIKGIRHKLIGNNIEYNNLGQLCNITTGRQDANMMSENGKYPFFTCGRETLRINDYAFDCEAILIAGNGDIGHTKYYNGKFNAYQRTYVLKDFSVNSRFVKCAIDYFLPIKIASETQNGAMPYIKINTLLSLKIPNISIEKQKYVVNVMNVFETKLNKEKDMLTLYQKQKAYLISNMFI